MPTLPDNQIVQNVAISRADSSVPTILDGLTNTNGNPHQFPSSSIQYNFVESHPMSRVPVEQERLISYNLNGQSGTVLKRVNQQPSKPNQGTGDKPGLQPTSGHPVSSLQFKRKAITERTQENQGPQKMSAPNKRVTQVGFYSTYPSASPVSVLKKNSSKASASGRKVVQIEPVINESRSNNIKKNVQPQVSPKGRTESSDIVRAKLRESLASALALVSQAQEGSPDGKMNIEKETVEAVQDGLREHKSFDCPSSNGAAPLESSMDGKPLIPPPAVDDKTLLSYQSKEIFGEVSQTESFLGTDFQCNSVLPGDDSLFSSGLYFKDEFLQGNGLSWESDLSLDVPKLKENGSTVKHEPLNEYLTSDVEKKTVQRQSPESVALAIEGELFKMFGGVNKKYKEKGRSLLFNLKDRNNPELRERVMSGDLPPDRLCSMTAEELASRELSQWRIAKAEELDNMKVLPDTDINMRRLVKKTHKGEYQVDFDNDSGVLEETPVDASVVPSKLPKVKNFDGVASPKSKRTKADQCEITIPSDGADMQGLMGDDLNDLPPVISLDEFMESLNQDPPFENLPVDSITTRDESDKENVELGSRNLSPTESPKYPVQKMSTEKLEVKKESLKIDGDKNLTGTLKRFDTNSAVPVLKRECVWEGQMQISLSSTANFMALYKSGEKTSCREWARFFDIKGRVKHVAFEKFLKELPMSRSRAIMVTHFVLNEEVTDNERASLKQFVDSYIADARVGFAEPGNGVELYLCAPRSKSVDMIVNHLPKSYTDKLNEIDDGLIGIVVWRKVQITSSAMSPISSSQPQQQLVVKEQIRGQFVDNNDMNRNNVFAPKRASPPTIVSNSQPVDDEDDDAPPGFGPPGPRDDDDLPEFQFSGGSHPSVSSLPIPSPLSGQETGFQHHFRAPPLQVDQMRELIQKYGQNGSNTGNRIPTEPWNDDDDDIPEWQPQPIQNPVLPTHIVNHPPHMANQQTLQRPHWPQVVQSGPPLQPLQPPMGIQHQRAWGLYGRTVGSLPAGQFLGPPGPGSAMDWRSYDHNSRNG